MDARVSTPRAENPGDNSIGDLFHQLVDDGRSLVTAEVNLYKQIGLYRFGKARNGLIALAAAGFLAYAGLIAFLVGVVMGLADFLGPVLGGLVVLAVTGIAASILEKAAIKAGETRL